MEENEVLQESSSEETTTTPESSEQQVAQKEASDAERNFAALREARKKAERERDEYQRKLAEYEAHQKQEPQKQRNADDLAEWQDVQKVKAELDSKLKEIELRSSHPDIDKVVSKDNVDRLRESDPELAQMIYETQQFDQIKALKMAYKFIKKMNLDQDYSKEKELIESNKAKPQSSSAAAKTGPLNQANDFIADPEARRKMLYKQMQEAASNR